MWWSYEVLGWGGYWAWDPVENASFLPWLTATAFLHSVMVEERRGMLKVWNLSLITATFLLTILGTFLTRSGVLSSVHAFAEGEIGYYFLVFIAIVLLASLALLAGRSSELRGVGKLDAALSRETVFLLNNLVLATFTFTVLLGTLFPLVAEAVRGVKVSVGAPFFNRMTTPMSVTLLFLMGVGPALPWRVARRDALRRQFLLPVAAMLLAAGAAAALVRPGDVDDVYTVIAFAFAAFALTVNVREFAAGARARMRAHGEGAATALARLIAANRRRYGGYTAHIGAIIIAIGIAASSAFRAEHEATVRPGETITLRGYTTRLDGLWARQEPQRFVVGADVTVLRGGREAGRLDPRLNFYPTSDQPISTPAVRSRAGGDLYLNLMAFQRDGSSATLRVIVQPLVPWIWAGGGVIVLGVLISMWPAGRRVRAPSWQPEWRARPATLAPVEAPMSPAATPEVMP
jgi:cytochrome c-type biogenesis protein CcmF